MKLPLDVIALAYAVLALLGGTLSLWFNGGNLWIHPEPKLALDPVTRELAGIVLGTAFGMLVATLTRISVAHASWARALHAELRPVAVGLSIPAIVILAVMSSLGEEMFFRSFLSPKVGIVIQALIFGGLHQMRGAGRWVWIVWASAMGLSLGLMHWFVGSLTGPIVAHALINGVNLMFLRDFDPADARPQIGGLLRGPVPDETPDQPL